MNNVSVHLRAAALRGQDRDATDAEPLTAYAECRDETALAGLLHRHMPMVLGVCTLLLGHRHDAEDAFQATFLVLARKAAMVRPRSALAGWLHGVAVRAAHKVRVANARQRSKEKEVATMPRPADDAAECPDSLAALHRELGRLPNDLRAAVVLCDLEGKTRTAAARQLGWPEGTVASRLARARRVLARRLRSPAMLAPLAPVVVPTRLFADTLSAATRFAAGSQVVASAGAVATAEEVITDMVLAKLTKVIAVLLVGVAALGLGLGLTFEPTVAAPAAKSGSTTNDLAAALKTARPINVGLLEQDEVLTDLKCTPDQRQAIAELIKAAQDEYREALKGAVRQVAAPGGGAVRVSSPPTIKYDTDKLTAVLKPEQLNRVRQLELHLKGPQAFADRRVVRALALTADQEAKVEEIIVRYEPQLSAHLGAAMTGKDGEKALAELGDKFTADCVKLLTKEQQATWDWLVGKRPAAGSWVRASANFPSAGFGMFNVQGGAVRVGPGMPGLPGGGAVVVPAAPGAAPPPLPPPPVVVPPKKGD